MRYRKQQASLLRFCYLCGGKLKWIFVKAELTRRHVCFSCKQITYVNPKVVAGCIPVMSDGKVVLLKRGIEPGRGLWSFPAGFLEMGETLRQGARRETWEEINTRVRLGRLVGIYSYPKVGVVMVVFAGKVVGRQIPTPGLETQTVKRVDPKKINWRTLAFRSTVVALRDWQNQSKE
jgi:ADP-ribose pyrophosphatase YjhB (NUDIX family)